MAGDDEVTRADFTDAVRFVADAGMQRTLEAARIEALLRATVRVLVEMGTLDLPAFERNLLGAPAEPATPPRRRISLQMAKPVDKHAVATPADLDCAALMPVCQARCCMLTFPLTDEEVAGKRLAWSYGQPYHIAHGPDHRCVHQARPTGECTVYADRPAICRTYDCRTDSRVWLDFENRIPAPLDAVRLLRER